MGKINEIEKTWKKFKSGSSGRPVPEKCVILIFGAVAVSLLWVAKKLHMTYNEVNVIAYYWLMPASWTLLIDFKMEFGISTPMYSGTFPLLTFILCSIWLGIIVATFWFFSKWCDFVFRASQAFLCIFNRWGGNYILNSVVICVIVPAFIYMMLLLS